MQKNSEIQVGTEVGRCVVRLERVSGLETGANELGKIESNSKHLCTMATKNSRDIQAKLVFL